MGKKSNTNVQFKRPTTQREREEYANQYTPLVYKIANQNKDKTPLTYDDIIGFGFEGLADAMNTYNPDSGQSFLQYAAYRIYYFIMNGTNREGHIVTFSNYQQKKAKAEGRPTYIHQSILSRTDSDGEEHWNIPEPSVDPDRTSVDNALEDIRIFVTSHFSARDADIFFQTFGLGDKEDVPRTQIAKQYKVSSAAITYVNQRIITAIRSDEVLCEELEDLL